MTDKPEKPDPGKKKDYSGLYAGLIATAFIVGFFYFMYWMQTTAFGTKMTEAEVQESYSRYCMSTRIIGNTVHCIRANYSEELYFANLYMPKDILNKFVDCQIVSGAFDWDDEDWICKNGYKDGVIRTENRMEIVSSGNR